MAFLVIQKVDNQPVGNKTNGEPYEGITKSSRKQFFKHTLGFYLLYS